jgi:hypothetical protein
MQAVASWKQLGRQDGYFHTGARIVSFPTQPQPVGPVASSSLPRTRGLLREPEGRKRAKRPRDHDVDKPSERQREALEQPRRELEPEHESFVPWAAAANATRLSPAIQMKNVGKLLTVQNDKIKDHLFFQLVSEDLFPEEDKAGQMVMKCIADLEIGRLAGSIKCNHSF